MLAARSGELSALSSGCAVTLPSPPRPSLFRVSAFDLFTTEKTHLNHEKLSKNSSAICLTDTNMTTEQATDLSARHYGFASFSYATLLKSIVGSSKRGNLTECGVLLALYNDRVHPSHGLGSILLSDALTHYLAKSRGYHKQEHNSAQQLQQRQGQHRKCVGPLNTGSMVIPHMTCYGEKSMLNVDLAGNETTGNIDGSSESYLPVTNYSEGWAFVAEEYGKKKPGWISYKPGSFLMMTFNESASPTAGGRQSIILTHLRSHQHMGTASLSCLRGCHCTAIIMNGHEPQHKHSVPQMARVDVQYDGLHKSGTQDRRECTLQVQVLNSTDSGEHKFKIIQLNIISMVNISDLLQFSK